MRTFKNLLHVFIFVLIAFSAQTAFAGSAAADMEMQQAERTIRGAVVAEDGEALIGVSIRVPGSTTTGTITNYDGEYTIQVPGGARSLQFTYVGMKSLTVDIDNRTSINVTMEYEAIGLNEVVAIGYGTAQRKDLTGSVASVSAETLARIPVASPTEALTGKMAGVQVTVTEGSPDAEMKIRVRGGGSITQSNEPLFIVDGFPVASISDIPTTDIESIDVLKDASSTAIYGSRGANGVVIVTTKTGKTGRVTVNYNAYAGLKKIAKTLDVLEPYDYVKWQYELAALKGTNEMKKYTSFFGNYQDLDLYQNVPANDWQNLTFGRTGNTFNHNLSVTGGSDKIRYSFSYTHMNDKAIMQQSSFKRDNLSLKLNNKITDRLTLDLSARLSNTGITGGGANDTKSTYDSDRRLKYSVIYTPIPISNLDETAGSDDDDLGNLYNPLESIDDNAREQNRKNWNLGSALTWEAIKNLKLRAEVGLDDKTYKDKRFWGLTTYYIKNVPASANQNKPAIQLLNRTGNALRSSNTISYNFKEILPKAHGVDVMAGHEYIIEKTNTLTNVVHGFPESFTARDAWKLSTQGVPFSTNNFINEDDKLLSFFGRANYDYESKYLISLTFRADASSRFSKDNRWGYFPSAAAAWRISSEPFMADTRTWLDDLKLRFSYGTAGNNNIPTGQMAQNYASSSTSWINGYSSYWAPSKTMANPDLKWETTVTRNAGLDITTFNSRLSGTIEVYLNTTRDLLIRFPVSGTGYDYQYRNMGNTENRGIEFTANYVAVDKKNFGLSMNANIGFNKTKITSLGMMEDFGAETYWASTEIGYDYWVSVGGAVGQMIGYRSDGRYEVDDFESVDANGNWKLKEGVADASAVVGTIRPGTMKLKDLVGDDNLITTDDREIIGDANPLHTGGFNLNARLYGFDFGASFNWSVGNDIYNANKIEFTQTSKYQFRNMITTMADGQRWTNLRPDGTISNDPAELAAMNANTTLWSPLTQRMVFSDWAVEKASFLRLNTLTLGYSLPESAVNAIRAQSLRFYVTGYNVFVFTNYSGYDPEVSTMRNTNLTPGVDYSAYPRSRQIVFGLNIGF
jgi:TonB-linked SusC/RagA family outer membrane protein